MSSFWNSQDVRPKRNYKFRVQFSPASATAGAAPAATVLWWAKTVTLPSFDVSEVEHDYFDNKYYFPGRTTWNDVSLTLVDPISVDAAAQTSALLENSGYQIASNNASKTSTINKSQANAAAGTVTITVYEEDLGALTAVETWTLNNAWIKSAKYGDLDYSSDDFKMIELVLRYDWASHQPGDTTAAEFFTAS